MGKRSGFSQFRIPRNEARRHERRAFTLTETLVVVAIIALLLTLLAPVVNSARGQMKSLMCAANMRTISMRFYMFADGNDYKNPVLGNGRFWIDDFQASLYGTGDFWDQGEAQMVTMKRGDNLMMCSSGPRELTKIADRPFGHFAITPLSNVSIGMNSRLYRAVTVNDQGQRILAPEQATGVTADILSRPYVPLVMDVDGAEARDRGVTPFYSTPPGDDSDDPYADGRYWITAKRHRGGTNVAFVGGHVLSSSNPSRESWDWKYQARVRD